MLQTDPAQRPEMEEVWRITRSVFDHQHHQSRSTHLMSEQAADKLLFLAAELRRQTEARKVLTLSPPLPPLHGAPESKQMTWMPAAVAPPNDGQLVLLLSS